MLNMETTANMKKISAFVTCFLLENAPDNVVGIWKGKENMEKFREFFEDHIKVTVKKLQFTNLVNKDPNKPKKNKSAYIYFCADKRDLFYIFAELFWLGWCRSYRMVCVFFS